MQCDSDNAARRTLTSSDFSCFKSCINMCAFFFPPHIYFLPLPIYQDYTIYSTFSMLKEKHWRKKVVLLSIFPPIALLVSACLYFYFYFFFSFKLLQPCSQDWASHQNDTLFCQMPRSHIQVINLLAAHLTQFSLLIARSDNSLTHKYFFFSIR